MTTLTAKRGRPRSYPKLHPTRMSDDSEVQMAANTLAYAIAKGNMADRFINLGMLKGYMVKYGMSREDIIELFGCAADTTADE